MQGSEYVSGLLKLICCSPKVHGYTGKLIYAKLITLFTFFPYSKVIHGSTTFKLTKG